MFSLNSTAALLAIAVLLSGVSYFAGIDHERDARKMRDMKQAVESFRQAELMSRKLYAVELELEKVQGDLEAAANEDPDSGRVSVSVRSVRRLNQIGAAP